MKLSDALFSPVREHRSRSPTGRSNSAVVTTGPLYSVLGGAPNRDSAQKLSAVYAAVDIRSDDLSSLPKGAILDGAQLFGRVGNTWLGGGEAGREALLPLDRNTGWMDKIADRVATRISSGSSGEQSLVIYLELDGKVITKTVVRNINAQAKATGKNPLAACM